jgi:sugar/nucleoside kinase (ribokinase family)
VPLSTEVVCSADFAIPDDGGGPLQWILDRGAELAAVTDGPAPVRWRTRRGGGAVDMEQFRAVDTLGAGDFFHGAYSFARTFGGDGRLEPAAALKFAGHIAALKCASPGTREWLDGLAGSGPLDYLRTVRP